MVKASSKPAASGGARGALVFWGGRGGKSLVTTLPNKMGGAPPGKWKGVKPAIQILVGFFDPWRLVWSSRRGVFAGDGVGGIGSLRLLRKPQIIDVVCRSNKKKVQKNCCGAKGLEKEVETVSICFDLVAEGHHRGVLCLGLLERWLFSHCFFHLSQNNALKGGRPGPCLCLALLFRDAFRSPRLAKGTR